MSWELGEGELCPEGRSASARDAAEWGVECVVDMQMTLYKRKVVPGVKDGRMKRRAKGGEIVARWR